MTCLACFEIFSILHRASKEAGEKLAYKIRETTLQMYPIINADILPMIVQHSEGVRWLGVKSQETDPEYESNE